LELSQCYVKLRFVKLASYRHTSPSDGLSCASAGASWTLIGSSTVPYTDMTAMANKAYVYRVRSVKSGTQSPPSTTDFATTVVFTDDPIIAGTTLVEGAHLAELRTAAEALRVAAGLAPFSYTDTVTAGLLIKAAHITELRAAINAARTQLDFLATPFADPALAPGDDVRAVHLNELRGGVR
jgi:hypothetical protein